MKDLKNVIIFGYGKFGNSIANSIKKEKNANLLVAVNSEDEFNLAYVDGIKVVKFNIESDTSILNLGIDEDTILVCAIDDNRQNLFLSLTLRGLFKNSYIIAVSDSTNLTNKLKMAGVNRVIDIYTISGKIISNILKIPVATKFLQGFINRSHNYHFKEIKIKENSKVVGKYLNEIEFNRFNIIFIGMINRDKGNQFIFTTVSRNYKLDKDDIIVCIGTEENLLNFINKCVDGDLEWNFQ